MGISKYKHAVLISGALIYFLSIYFLFYDNTIGIYVLLSLNLAFGFLTAGIPNYGTKFRYRLLAFFIGIVIEFLILTKSDIFQLNLTTQSLFTFNCYIPCICISIIDQSGPGLKVSLRRRK